MKRIFVLAVVGLLCSTLFSSSAGAAAGDVVLSFNARAGNSVGLTWANGYLWNIDHGHYVPAQLLKLDPNNGNVLQTVILPIEHVMGLAWDGASFWAVSHEDSIIYQLNATDGSIISSIPSPNPGTVETGCEGLAWDGQYLWYADSDLDRIYRIDTSDGSIVSSFSAPSGEAQGLAWDGSYLWSFIRLAERIYKHDPTDGSVVTSFPAPGRGEGDLAFDGTYLWLSRNWADWIYKIDVGTPSNQPPVADADGTYSGDEGTTITFDASGSTDPDGDALEYRWDFDNDGVWDTGWSTNPSAGFTYGDDYADMVVLEVSDGEFTDTDSSSVTVVNVDPTFTLEPPNMEVEIGLRVAGRKYNEVGMTLYEEDILIGYISIERLPGSPDDQMVWFPFPLDMSRSYSATVTFLPEDPPNVGANPVWIYLRSENGSMNGVHHTFNVQQSMRRDSDHWNHVEPWEVDLNGHFIGLPFEITSHVTDPGSDDLFFAYTYCSQTVTVSDLNDPPNPDPNPSPELNPRDVIHVATFFYEGPGTLSLTATDDDGGITSQVVIID